MEYSPLFWPVQFQDGVIQILDETALPHKLTYITAANCRQACLAIKDMKTRAVGQVILVFYIFLQVLEQNKDSSDLMPVLAETAQEINATRPTLSFKYLTDMVLGWAKSGAPLEQRINGFLEALKHARMGQAREMAGLLADKDVVLTHCNVSGLMPMIAEFALAQGKEIKFFATETRPYMQGSRLTAWELQERGCDVTIIADNMVAQVMSEGRITRVVVGADNLAQNGDFANKIGTYQIALLAKHFAIPFYVLCPPASRAASGKEITIEIRPDKELLWYEGVALAPKGAKGYYPAFDITPAAFVTKHIKLELTRQ